MKFWQLFTVLVCFSVLFGCDPSGEMSSDTNWVCVSREDLFSLPDKQKGYSFSVVTVNKQKDGDDFIVKQTTYLGAQDTEPAAFDEYGVRVSTYIVEDSNAQIHAQGPVNGMGTVAVDIAFFVEEKPRIDLPRSAPHLEKPVRAVFSASVLHPGQDPFWIERDVEYACSAQ
ncbi:MAG: hypothetical protein AB7F43_07545 [Bacteriovoracia bacterium]